MNSRRLEIRCKESAREGFERVCRDWYGCGRPRSRGFRSGHDLAWIRVVMDAGCDGWSGEALEGLGSKNKRMDCRGRQLRVKWRDRMIQRRTE